MIFQLFSRLHFGKNARRSNKHWHLLIDVETFFDRAACVAPRTLKCGLRAYGFVRGVHFLASCQSNGRLRMLLDLSNSLSSQHWLDLPNTLGEKQTPQRGRERETEAVDDKEAETE